MVGGVARGGSGATLACAAGAGDAERPAVGGTASALPGCEALACCTFAPQLSALDVAREWPARWRMPNVVVLPWDWAVMEANPPADLDRELWLDKAAAMLRDDTPPLMDANAGPASTAPMPTSAGKFWGLLLALGLKIVGSA